MPMSTAGLDDDDRPIYVNDAYGTKTETAGTIIKRVIPPRSGARAKVGGLSYTAAATAHTLSVLTTVNTVSVASEAASGQAVVNISSVPTTFDGSIVAANDWFVLQYEDGTWDAHIVNSISGKAVTFAANLSQKVLADSQAFFMGAPADHSDRQFTIDASQTLTIAGGDDRLGFGTGSSNGTPILVHSTNATNAGLLRWLAYYYGTA